MEGFENNENHEYDIRAVDFPFICRICLKRSDSRLFKVDYLLNLYLTITKINVCSTTTLPENICNDCIKTLEDISLFIDMSKYNKAKSGQNFIPMNKSEHIETAECGMSQKCAIESEETIEEDLQYFKGFESCRICYSTNILKPVEEKPHLMQLFQNITKIDIIAEVVFSNRNSICNKCIQKLEIISLFISDSLCNEMKLKNTIGRNEAVETEHCLEGNGIDMCYSNEVKNEGDFDKNAHSYDSKSSHTIIDIKEEIADTLEASTEKLNQIGLKNFSESHSEGNSLDCGPCKDELSTETNLKNLLNGLDINLVIQTGTNRFKCDSYVKSFSQRHTLKSHSFNHFNHTRDKPLKCNYCKITFNRKSNNLRHMLIHTGEKPFKCDCCEKSFSQKRTLQQHRLSQTGEKRFKCISCEKSFTRKVNLKIHLFTHTGEKPFKCKCCKKGFTHKLSIQQHMLIHLGKKPFKCDGCEKSFSQKRILQKHMLIHTGEKPFKCECCEKCFIQKSNFQRHMLIHSGKKLFKCGCCEKTFALKPSLKRHLFTHTGEKPFKCEYCEKSFSEKKTLQQHMLNHTGEKPFKCDSCEKSFALKQSLKRHLFTHTGEKPFKCECCEKSFSQKRSLQQHMLIHTGDKSFKCGCCGKSFTFKHSLKRHILTHTGEQPFECDFCKIKFNMRSNLQRHLLTHTEKVHSNASAVKFS